jgi:uncharacterized protein YggE
MKNVFYFASGLLILLFALFFIKLFDFSIPLTIVSTTRSSELSVVGEGKIDAVPDTAYVDAGITVNNVRTIEEVQKKIDEVNNKIIDGLKGLGIKKEDIKTSNYSINPNYIYEGGQSRITGYNGNVTISVKIKDMKKAPDAVTQVTEAGANQVNGIRFTIDSPEKLREVARDKAIQNAKDQAKRLAQKLGIRLGKVVNIVESNQDVRPIPLYESALKMGGIGTAAPEIEPGTQTITSVVTLYFERK